MILKKGAKSFCRASGLQRRFCAKEAGQKSTYKPLILYTAGIAVVGALGGSYYTQLRIAKKSQQDGAQSKAELSQEQSPVAKEAVLQSEEPAKAEPASKKEEKGSQEDEEQMKLVSELFCSDRLPVPLRDLGGQELVEGSDGMLLLVPPKVDRELFEKVSGMIGNLQSLYMIANSSKKDGEGLQAYYVKIDNLEGLTKVGDKVGVSLTASEDVPLVIIRNKYLEKPKVITLMDLLEREEKFYNSFRPLKEVTANNTAKFQKILAELQPEEAILFEYADPNSSDFKKLRSEFYSKTLHERLANTKSLEQVFVQSAEWLPESAGVKLEHGGLYLLQKESARVLTSAEKVSLIDSEQQYLVYKVAQESPDQPVDVKDLLRQAGAHYYARNLAINPDLLPKTSEYSLVFKYDLNKLVDTQIDSAIEVMKSVREALDASKISQDKVRLVMLPYSFSASEGKVVSLSLRQNLKNERKLDYLFHNKSKAKMREYLANHPEVARNESMELQFPEEFGFGPDYILKFLEMGMAGEIPDTVQSELPPKYERFSRKLCGDSFVDKVKKNAMEQVVFLYSTSCASCKKFTPLFEKLARENIDKKFMLTGKEGLFNRLNKDQNDIRGDKNYDSTPVFMYYRGDWKAGAYLYRQNFLTESSLREFLTLTSQFQLLGEQAVARAALAPRRAVTDLFSNTN